ncbi:GNAT family N-acetyltransferase [Arthrobacter psychrochitiniphilus]|nr:GNAT family N-acetyltransferase [Arthrobacter psychrochitiniphilus]
MNAYLSRVFRITGPNQDKRWTLEKCQSQPEISFELDLALVIMHLRTATAADFSFLTDVLLQAFNWSEDQTLTREQILQKPEISHYVVDWQSEVDFGFVAETDHGEPIGTAWARLLSEDDPGYGFVSSTTPELTLGVLPGNRGSGVGTALMTAIIEQAKKLDLTALSLSVEDQNPAVHLYERAGFSRVDRAGNSDTLLLHLA